MKKIITTEKAPAAIGTYSQAVQVGEIVYLSGQIGLDPKTGKLVDGGVANEAQQMFANLAKVAEAAGGSLSHIVKLTVYLLDMADFPVVNETMNKFWQPPYPARACIAVAGLPKGACIEADATLVLEK